MFMLNQVPRYQATRGAFLTLRPLTLSQKLPLALCDGRALALADLARATRQPAEEVAAALKVLRVHGLVRAL